MAILNVRPKRNKNISCFLRPTLAQYYFKMLAMLTDWYINFQDRTEADFVRPGPISLTSSV